MYPALTHVAPLAQCLTAIIQTQGRMMVLRASVWLGVCLVLSACGVAQQIDHRKARDEAQAADIACQTQFPRGSKQYVEHANCLNDAERRIIGSRTQYPDLLNLKMTYRSALAAKVQRGEMSLEDAGVQFAQVTAAISSEELNRNNARMAVQAQQSAAMGNLVAGLAALQQPTIQQPARPAFVNTNCRQTGTITNCTSY